MSKNILIGLSSANRASKYLYYGAYDTDDIQSLVSGELGIFWASKTTGPDADTGVYTGGGSNDDLTAGSGSNIDIADTPTMVTAVDKFYFAQGTGAGSAALLGNVIDPRNMSFKVLEYVATVKKVQTVTIAAATLVAGKVVSFSAYSKDAPVGAVGTAKEMNIEYTIPTGATATTIGAALKALVDAHVFSTQSFSFRNRTNVSPFIYSCAEAHSSDVVLTITWNTQCDGDIKNNSWATATSTIATTTPFTNGNGIGADIVELEKECAVERGYNPAVAASNLWNGTWYASASRNYHLVTITHYTTSNTTLGANPSVGVLQTQYIAIDTGNVGDELLEEVVSVLTDMVDKKALSPAA